MQEYIPTYVPPIEWSPDGRTRSKKVNFQRNAKDFFVPPICHSGPLINTRGPDRGRKFPLASFRCEYREQHSYHQNSTKVYHGLRVRTFGIKQVLPKVDALPELDYRSLGAEPTFTHLGFGNMTDEREKVLGGTFKRLLLTRQASKMQSDSFSTQYSDSRSAYDVISEAYTTAEPKKASCNIKVFLLASLILGPLTLLILFSSTSMNIELEHMLSMGKFEEDILAETQSNLYGQHIVIITLKNSLHGALVKKGVRVVTLLLIGPSGSGKSFTRKILEDAAINRGFAFARISNDPSNPHISKICEKFYSKYYQDLVIVIEDIDRDIEAAWKQQDSVVHSKHCAGFNRVVLIMVSSVFSKRIQQYMFHQCKFKGERLSIQSKDVMAFISKEDTSKIKFESSEEGHIIIPLIFLPLDMDHLKMCISKALLSRGVGKENHELLLNSVINEIEFYPQCGMRYPESGCKLVESKVDYFMHRRSHLQRSSRRRK